MPGMKQTTFDSLSEGFVLKSEISGIFITESDISGMDEFSLDASVLRAAGILKHERIMVCNLSNGERIETIVSEGRAGSRVFRASGAAARLFAEGDQINILSFVLLNQSQVRVHKPVFLSLDSSSNHPGLNREISHKS